MSIFLQSLWILNSAEPGETVAQAEFSRAIARFAPKVALLITYIDFLMCLRFASVDQNNKVFLCIRTCVWHSYVKWENTVYGDMASSTCLKNRRIFFFSNCFRSL